MTSTRLLKLCSSLLVTLAVAQTGAALAAADTPPASKSVGDIEYCMSKNLVSKAALRDLSLRRTDREGKSHQLRLRVFWKPSDKEEPRMTIRLDEPMAIRGSAYLLLTKGLSEEVYFHLPGNDRALKLTGENLSEPLWNTDISYAEIKQVLGVVSAGKRTRLPDASVLGHTTYVIQTDTPEESGYTKIVAYVDQPTCVLLKSEFFGKGNELRKVLEADVASLLTVEGYSLALNYVMRDLREKTSTSVALSDFTLLERMPERLFDPKRFFEPFE